MCSGEERPSSSRSEGVVLLIEGRAYRFGPDFTHPGGRQVLEDLHGQDATRQFRGLEGGHAHSAAAERLLQAYYVGSAAGREPPRPGCSASGRQGAAGGQGPQVDESKPLLSQVPRLGAQYAEWVHRPVPGCPRFFERDWMESLTKVKWWMVPLIWLPLVLYQASLAAPGLPWASFALLFSCGMVVWQLMEYCLHRYLFHVQPSTPRRIFLHFLLHGCHHKYPMDVERLVFPPLPASWVVLALHAALRALLPQAAARALFSGVLFGYVAYDCMHYLMHSGALTGHLKAAHMEHHYVDSNSNYGISSPLFDVCFGTRAHAPERRRPAEKRA